MMLRYIGVVAAAATIGLGAVVSAPPAKADDAGAVAAGVIGGLAAGAIIGSAASRPYYGGYYAYEPAPAYHYGYGYSSCYVHRERVFDGYGWRIRRVRVCD